MSQVTSVPDRTRPGRQGEERGGPGNVHVESGTGAWLRYRYRHIVVDEAQDLSAAHWKMLRAMAPQQPNDIFLVGDTHQRIYDNQVTLGSLGVNIRGRSAKLTLSYRTTREILGSAIGVLEGTTTTTSTAAPKTWPDTGRCCMVCVRRCEMPRAGTRSSTLWWSSFRRGTTSRVSPSRSVSLPTRWWTTSSPGSAAGASCPRDHSRGTEARRGRARRHHVPLQGTRVPPRDHRRCLRGSCPALVRGRVGTDRPVPSQA